VTNYDRGNTSGTSGNRGSMGDSASSGGTYGSGGTGTMGSTGGMGKTSTTTGTSSRRWDDYRDTYRTDWENRYGQNRPWSDNEEGYRYGWRAGQDQRWQGRNWDDASSDLERNWPNRHDYDNDDYQPTSGQGHTTSDHKTVSGKVEHVWNNVKDTVREGWDRARMDFGGNDSDNSSSNYRGSSSYNR